ncbi:hypothetical protein LPB19_03580 [Marinobacter salinisoli]|uniref:Tripartite tricarboxylate transporter TctB family protein n=1 Tax=Marinobacter salinisoli TaxID=2769486 RepID=A0ABX7MT62_9GAMM|nr:hypothetical protein [Marinobacter salinisoli]QSP95511.1 hypothetical protein LPB19_03580 [Marinobacter salinisoli]
MQQLFLKYIGAMLPRTHAALSLACIILGLVLVHAAAQLKAEWAVYLSALAFCGAVAEFLFFAISKSGQFNSQIAHAKSRSVTADFSWQRGVRFLFAGFFFLLMLGSQFAGAAISALFYAMACIASWAPAGSTRWFSLPAKLFVVSVAVVIALYYQPDTMNFNK